MEACLNIHDLNGSGSVGQARLALRHFDSCFRIQEKAEDILGEDVVPRLASREDLEQELTLIHKFSTGTDPQFGLFKTTRSLGEQKYVSPISVESLLEDTKTALNKISCSWQDLIETERLAQSQISLIETLQEFWSKLSSMAEKIKTTPLIVCYDADSGSRRLIINSAFNTEAQKCLKLYSTGFFPSDLEACDNAVVMEDKRVLELTLPHDAYIEQFRIKYSDYLNNKINSGWENKAIAELLTLAT